MGGRVPGVWGGALSYDELEAITAKLPILSELRFSLLKQGIVVGSTWDFKLRPRHESWGGSWRKCRTRHSEGAGSVVGAGELDMDKNESLFNFSILIQRFCLWLFSHECWSCFHCKAQFFVTEDQVTAWFLSKPTNVNVCSMCSSVLTLGSQTGGAICGLRMLPSSADVEH